MDRVNSAVRLIVLAFVFTGGAITLAGPQLVNGKAETAAAPEKPATTVAPNKSKLPTSAKQISLSTPDTTG